MIELDELKNLAEQFIKKADDFITKQKEQPISPGIPKDALCTFQDGNQFCCVRADFINLQESPAGFGNNREDAIVDYFRTIQNR